MSKLFAIATALTFAQAQEVLARGGMVKRADWNEEFVFRQVPSIIQADIVPKMQSLPDAVKAVFAKRFSELEHRHTGNISYDNQYALVNEKNEISGWLPDKQDKLYIDWCEVVAEDIVEKIDIGVTSSENIPSTPAKGNEPAVTRDSQPNGNTPG